jgi:hypothetical protein
MITPGHHLEASMTAVMKCQKTEADFISTSHYGRFARNDQKGDFICWRVEGNQRGEALFCGSEASLPLVGRLACCQESAAPTGRQK